MDWNFLVALGTVILAIATLLLVRQSSRQTDVLLQQANLQVGLQVPHLFIRQVQVTTDTVRMEIQNATSVPAAAVGLETAFFVVGQRLSADQKGTAEITWGEAQRLKEEGRTVYSKYYWVGPQQTKLRYDQKDVIPEPAMSFLSPPGVSVHFPPHSTIPVESDPIFLVSWKNDQDIPSYQGFKYGEFRDFLLRNNVRAVAVVISLLCKDSAERVQHEGTVLSFAIRTDLDHSLLESSKNVHHFDFIPLSYPETLSEHSWIPYDHYKNTYSSWHVF